MGAPGSAAAGQRAGRAGRRRARASGGGAGSLNGAGERACRYRFPGGNGSGAADAAGLPLSGQQKSLIIAYKLGVHGRLPDTVGG